MESKEREKLLNEFRKCIKQKGDKTIKRCAEILVELDDKDILKNLLKGCREVEEKLEILKLINTPIELGNKGTHFEK